MVAQIHFSRTMMAMFYVINIVLTTLGRSLIRILLQYIREKGYNLKYILLGFIHQFNVLVSGT